MLFYQECVLVIFLQNPVPKLAEFNREFKSTLLQKALKHTPRRPQGETESVDSESRILAEFQLTLIFIRAASTPPGCPAMDTCAQ